MIFLKDRTVLDPDRVLTEAECSRCGARPGLPCLGRRGPRETLHVQRWSTWTNTHRHLIARAG